MIDVIIKFFIKLFFPKSLIEFKEAKKHNINIMQKLLDREHAIRDMYNNSADTVYTTKRAIIEWNKTAVCKYNSVEALKNADFE